MSIYSSGKVKAVPDHMAFAEVLPSTPFRKIEHINTDYESMLGMKMPSYQAMGFLTPPNSFNMYTIPPQAAMRTRSFTVTPTRSLSGSDITDGLLSLSRSNYSPIVLFPQQKILPSQSFESLDLERHPQSSIHRYYLQGTPPSQNRLHAQSKMMVRDIQRKTSELQRSQLRESKKLSTNDGNGVDVHKATCKCDYQGCHKAFCRKEHLKRHKQTFHGEGPNRFSCEFCGKGQFNRRDNLNNHRKLHARPNNRNRGVGFIPAAVPIIDQETRSRKRRAPPRPKRLENMEITKQLQFSYVE
ncbi:hypothetical protein NLG97_g585 [Lecanicillium saksenae]|uniref:Uncharacterized protein n=1 Tax=Lecanicillium saksenae TaxID=468837 RepID=A0ACC1R8U2_9HYPO|nr:hypothetical protein NLG97_g585 [Lecanicillium saksenae]